ncbi:nucleotidyltransferase [Weeksella virosa]|uniref:nucleotidyltransferase n=1 Tax=Weeksella virosa TaxID=1014 RepID=UPI00255589F4|nr:nucleotidyltransferase [Weeksella virosa]MDK7376060.1 nucleotidyltransferase [Weeksella virosa]
MNIQDYKEQFTSAFMNNDVLVKAYGLDKKKSFASQFSVVSFESQLFDVLAICAFFLGELFNKHRKEMDQKILNQKTHRLEWIRNMFLNFQYGFKLKPESDVFDNASASEEEILQSKIIKYCAVNESSNQKEVIVKIATERNGEMSPIDTDKMEAILAYAAEVKGAGVPYRIINYLPDLLKLNIRIFRDALVLDANGMNRQTGEKSVEVALQEFMKELPFNGELRLQDLANKLERTSGVNLVQIDLAQTAWIDADKGTYDDYESIDVRRIPASGYFKIENFNGIRYVV